MSNSTVEDNSLSLSGFAPQGDAVAGQHERPLDPVSSIGEENRAAWLQPTNCQLQLLGTSDSDNFARRRR